jgi:pimeloyl-ACP methyl ester carboxylesterase
MCLLLKTLLLASFCYLLLAYALRWLERSNRPEFVSQYGERSIYHAGLRPVLYFCREYFYLIMHLGLLILDYLSWPLQGLHQGRGGRPAPGRRPVVLVHGYMMRGGVMWLIKRRLKRAGWGQVYLFNYSPPWRDIAHFARQLEGFISSLVPDSEAKVDIVAHSMGGLVSRYYINLLGGWRRVAHLVTLGAPHGGSMLWSFTIWASGRQMRPQSPLLKQLAEGDHRLREVAVTSIYGDFDELVIPEESLVLPLPGVVNSKVNGVGHVGLLFDRKVYQLIEQALSIPMKQEEEL